MYFDGDVQTLRQSAQGHERRLNGVQSSSAGPPTSRRNGAPLRTGGQCQLLPPKRTYLLRFARFGRGTVYRLKAQNAVAYSESNCNKGISLTSGRENYAAGQAIVLADAFVGARRTARGTAIRSSPDRIRDIFACG